MVAYELRLSTCFVSGTVTCRSSTLPWYESAARDQRWWLVSYDSAFFVLGAVTCRSSVLPWYESATRDQKWWLMTQHVRMPGNLSLVKLSPEYYISLLSNFLTFIIYISDDPNDGAEHDETGQHEQCHGGQPSSKLLTALYEFSDNPSYPFSCRIFVKFLRKLAIKDRIL
jgi:hypothetical protein